MKQKQSKIYPVSGKIFERVVSAFDPDALALACKLPTAKLFKKQATIVGAAGSQYAFTDNGAKILAVAHCDFVKDQPHFATCELTGDSLIYNTRLDDRLGVYTICDLLPKLGIVADILLTDNEEHCNSTAQFFQSQKQYSWIFQFDRRGEDIVLYDYEAQLDWYVALDDFFAIDCGSYTCIRELEHLGACGVNIGCGYHGEHTSTCFMSVGEYCRQIARFVAFHEKHKNTAFPFSHRPIKQAQRIFDGFPPIRYQHTLDDCPPDLDCCQTCGQYISDYEFDTNGDFICPNCQQLIPEDQLDFLFGDIERQPYI